MYVIFSASRVKKILLLLAVAGAGCAVLLRPAAVATGVSRGLSVCGSVIIPALFPFLILGGLLVKTGLCDAIGRRCDCFSRRVFGMSGALFGCWLLSLVGGYLSGAAAIAALVRSGRASPAEARRALRVSVCAGPGFLIGGVGSAMCGAPRFGLILWGGHTPAAILLAVGQGFLLRKHPLPPTDAPPPKREKSAFVAAVEEAVRALLTGCGFVLLFSVILSLCDTIGLSERLPVVLPALLEVTEGCLAVVGRQRFSPLLLGLCAGWGGLSVHAQVSALTADFGGTNGSYFCVRLLHALLGGGLSALIFRLVPMPLGVFRNFSDATVSPFSVSAAVSLCLLLMTALFLLSGRKTVVKIKEKRLPQ